MTGVQACAIPVYLNAVNSTSFTGSAQYTHQFTQRFMVTTTASYLKGRGEFGDRYRLGATGYYRIDRKWTLQAGVDYAKYPGAFSSGGGVSFSIGLVFQPDYRRRAEARYESRDNQAELSYRQSGPNPIGRAACREKECQYGKN